MLLTIDIGNSNIVLGLFDKQKLIKDWRIETKKDEQSSYYIELLTNELGSHLETIHDLIIGSVVPRLDSLFSEICTALFKTTPLFARSDIHSGISNLSDNCELGADRLANMSGAIALYPGNAIIVDLGTATTFEIVSAKNEYLGGAIAPGVGTSLTALMGSASKLSLITLKSPEKLISTGTENQLDIGFVVGFSSMVEGMVTKMKDELGWSECTIIGTGGFATLISQRTHVFSHINLTLTLEGLRTIWELNRKDMQKSV